MPSPSRSSRRGGRALAVALFAGLAASLGAAEAPADVAARSLRGCHDAAAVAFVDRYCAACHTASGRDPKQRRAYAVLQLDRYEQWKASATVIVAVVDKWHLDGRIMPPPSAKAQPTDAERRAILAWLARGSPDGTESP